VGVKVTLHPFLNDGVETQLEVEGASTGDCLREVLKRFPAMEEKMFARPGQLRGHVEVLVNGKPAYPNELTAPVASGDSIWVLVFLAGG
jgi:hypothetical protein